MNCKRRKGPRVEGKAKYERGKRKQNAVLRKVHTTDDFTIDARSRNHIKHTFISSFP